MQGWLLTKSFGLIPNGQREVHVNFLPDVCVQEGNFLKEQPSSLKKNENSVKLPQFVSNVYESSVE